LKEHGLHAVPIGSELGYKASPESAVVENLFESVGVKIFLAPLTRLGPSVLGRHTLQELLVKLYPKEKVDWILNHYAYSSELRSMRADVALNSFLSAMGTHEGYSVVAEGFSELVQRMIAALPADRVVVLGRHTLTDVRPAEGGATDCVFEYKELKTIVLRARQACVLALHSDALKAVAPFQSWGPLRHLKMEPLLRIYMIFPLGPTGTPGEKGPWFKGLGRVVFSGGLRYMIPIDESKGTIMISYTDGADTKHYRKLVEKYGDESRELTDAVLCDVRRWWPEIRVPSPTYTKAHLWAMGCTYWQPLGKKEVYVSADELMTRTHQPYPRSLPGVYVAGESFSAGNQCWVEGALETAEAVVKMIK
jgi:hypothetical protein